MDVTALRVTVVDAAFDPSAPMWGDATEGWVPPAVEWLGTLAAAGVPHRALGDRSADGGEGLLLLPDPDAWPDLAADAAAAGRPLLTGPPPPGAAARLAAVRDAMGALVCPDLRGVLVLRLDDPGAAVRRYLDGWRHDDVSPEAWSVLWSTLGGFGRMSLFCCPGWVDDTGTVRRSREVNPAEWSALDEGVRQGRADLECHGYTHLVGDLEAWRTAPDRFADPAWYREMWPPRSPVEPAASAQAEVIARWQAAVGAGTTLVAPGEAWGVHTVAAARDRGLQLMNSWGVCRLQQPVPTWSRGIGSPYLDEPDPSWLAEGLPAVGYWHDRDMALHGPSWVPAQLADWRDAGVQRAWAFADLARAYAVDVDAALVAGQVEIRRAPDVPLRVELR